MGGNVSKETQDSSVAAYTYYGFGCRCRNRPVFEEGAPANTCCGTSCGRVAFEPPADRRQTKALADLEQDLDAAAAEAAEHVKSCSYLWCAQIDFTAAAAAAALNDGWCRKWNETSLREAGLRCLASSEVFGFGRSRVTYLVIRVSESSA